MKIEKEETLSNGQIHVWVRFTGLRPLWRGVGKNKVEAIANAQLVAVNLLNQF